ncbi:hypothetical protein L1987_24934 [Smallanthus sonchifolius]|uniref:Uncharacterized protein n=1 Tax=Smallanthus sonchifolius TaxID=185202 RepID=A0ACB9IMF1_9ASTR|nr:hypothetical protein L1987_24934 [Smallanthus sonchifolius]
MEAGSCIPCVEQYSAVIDSLCKDKMPDTWILLYKQWSDSERYYLQYHVTRSLGSKELMKDVLLHNILIDGCSKCGKANLAMDLFDELLLKGLKPTVSTYTVMIRVYCQEGLLVKGKELLRKMEDNGCLPDSVTYNVIVQELLKKNECEEAADFLEEMINQSFMPDPKHRKRFSFANYHSKANKCRKKRCKLTSQFTY